MVKIFAIKENSMSQVKIEQLPLTRDWLDETFDRHAYHCFPMTIANRMGWGISYPKDISFVWNGSTSPKPDSVAIISGHEFVNTYRGNATITFKTGYKFESEKNISLLTSPVPNQFIRGAQCITTIMSTSLAPGSLEIAWRMLEPNQVITIPAGTPVASIMPISLTDLQEHEMIISNQKPISPKEHFEKEQRSKFVEAKNSVGDWSHLYRDGLDYLGNVVGKHEAKSIKLITREL